jgi:hypothetical protein
MAREYRLARCRGEDNVSLAIQKKTNEVPPWEVHSIVVSGTETIEQPLRPNEILVITHFLVLFERAAMKGKVDA